MSDAIQQQSKKTAIDLDALLDPFEAAQWLGIRERTILDNVRRKKIPVVRINERVLRFHPRSILAAKGVKF
jgi:hypothetical protein